MKPPCYECAGRHETCHVTCGKYISYAEENARRREMRWQDYLHEKDIICWVINNTIERNKKERRK